jgi:WD40 repeat protein
VTDGRVTVWRNGARERSFEAHEEWVRALAILPTGRLVTCSDDDTIKLWKIDAGRPPDLERRIDVGDDVHSVAVMPDGEHLVVGLGCGEIVLFNVDGTLVHTFEAEHDLPTADDIEEGSDDEPDWAHDWHGHTCDVYAVALTPDGQHIISGSRDGSVKVWDVALRSLVSTFNATPVDGLRHFEGVLAVAAMPDGQRILSGDADGRVRLWPLRGVQGRRKVFDLSRWSHQAARAGERPGYVVEGGDVIWAIIALPDNQHALVGSQDKTVMLIDVNDRPSSRSILRTFRHHTGPVRCLCLLPDGIRFVSGSSDGNACIVETGLAAL